MFDQMLLLADDDNEIYRIGNEIQQNFWDYNDNRAHPLHQPKARNLYTFIKSIHPSVNDKVVKKFVNNYNRVCRKVPVAGVIALNRERNKVLLVKNFNSKSWSFPKGKVSCGETDVDCALRECLEETGYCPATSNIVGCVKKPICDRPSTFFIVSDFPENYSYRPHNVNEITSIEWHPLSDALRSRKYNIYVNQLYPELAI